MAASKIVKHELCYMNRQQILPVLTVIIKSVHLTDGGWFELK